MTRAKFCIFSISAAALARGLQLKTNTKGKGDAGEMLARQIERGEQIQSLPNPEIEAESRNRMRLLRAIF